MIKEIIIVGAFHEVIELAENNGYEIKGLIDSRKTGKYMGYEIIGNDSDAEFLSKQYPLIITPDKPVVREQLYLCYKILGYRFISLISKASKISKSTFVAEGTVIQNGVNVSSECRIGKFVKLNTNCNIMHNTEVGDFSTIAPNAVILGRVKIGRNCYIGANATVLPDRTIGNNVVIGAGAVVTKDVQNKKVIVGNPAREIK